MFVMTLFDYLKMDSRDIFGVLFLHSQLYVLKSDVFLVRFHELRLEKSFLLIVNLLIKLIRLDLYKFAFL